MTNPPLKVLAIDPGTRHTGVAFFEGEELLYHGVITFKQYTSPHMCLEEGRRRIHRLITGWKPDILVTEKTFVGKNRNAALLNVFMEEIKSLGILNQIQVKLYSANTVRKHICGNGTATKEEVARTVITHYPELKVYLNQIKRWQFKYHANMFDAVALGMMALKK